MDIESTLFRGFIVIILLLFLFAYYIRNKTINANQTESRNIVKFSFENHDYIRFDDCVIPQSRLQVPSKAN